MDFSQSEVAYFDPIAYLADPFKKNTPPPTNPFGLLKFHGNKVKRLAEDEPKVQRSDLLSKNKNPGSSALMIMKSARARLDEITSNNSDAFSILANCLGDLSSLTSISLEDFEIVLLLQAAAEKIAAQKFTCAGKLLRVCMSSSCINGTSVQRMVYYFSEALQARIDLEIGVLPNHECYTKKHDVIQTQFSLQPAVMRCPQQFKSIHEIHQFAGIQSILDGVGSARRIHIIDLGIRNGSQWTVLMQALSERKICPIEHLKITAIGTSEDIMIETSKRLWSFAETMNIPFSFGIVLSDLKDIEEDFLELEPDETIAVYSSMCLFRLVAWPSHLESLLGVIKSLKPHVMVVHELQASTNSPVFLERFDGTLSFFSTAFDCLTVYGVDHPYRKLIEETYFRIMIRNILVAEGTERIQRHEKLDFWRALFVRCGYVETALSSSALCQAKLLQNTYADYSSCTLDVDGKSLLLGWKGGPFEFISTWKL